MNKHVYFLQNNKGFTLIETIIAFVILFIAVASICLIMDASAGYYLHTQNKSQLISTGKGLLEQIISDNEYLMQENKDFLIENSPEIDYEIIVSNFKSSRLKKIELRVFLTNEPQNFINLITVRCVQ